MKLVIALAAALALSGCTYTVSDPDRPQAELAKCHEGPFTSFCLVYMQPNTSVVSGSGVVTGSAALVLGTGTTLLGAVGK